jgi:hypothetical protein
VGDKSLTVPRLLSLVSSTRTKNWICSKLHLFPSRVLSKTTPENQAMAAPPPSFQNLVVSKSHVLLHRCAETRALSRLRKTLPRNQCAEKWLRCVQWCCSRGAPRYKTVPGFWTFPSSRTLTALIRFLKFGGSKEEYLDHRVEIPRYMVSPVIRSRRRFRPEKDIHASDMEVREKDITRSQATLCAFCRNIVSDPFVSFQIFEKLLKISATRGCELCRFLYEELVARTFRSSHRRLKQMEIAREGGKVTVLDCDEKPHGFEVYAVRRELY